MIQRAAVDSDPQLPQLRSPNRSIPLVGMAAAMVERTRQATGVSERGQPPFTTLGSMKRIPLFGKEGIIGHALVDDEDYGWVSQLRWCLSSRDDCWAYAVTVTKDGGERLSMHRAVLNAPEGLVVDHINGDRLDNRKANLRPVTVKANAENLGLRRNNTSGFRGVYQVRKTGRWKAVVEHLGKKINCGTFATAEEAGRAAEAKRRELGFMARESTPTSAPLMRGPAA